MTAETESRRATLWAGLGARRDRPVRRQFVFRELNEQIAALADRFGLGTVLELVCECGSRDCLERLVMSPEEYEAVRRFPTRFVLKPGHATSGVERVVSENDHAVAVEKVGKDAEAAILSDPRRRATRWEKIA
jgi:hypothetical protein